MTAFETWFAAQNFKHFTAQEFTEYFKRSRNGVKNSPPPRKLWDNLIPTLRIVDELRATLGRPIVILSSYRSPAYNKAIGGAAASIHMQFNALDIAVSGVSPATVFKTLDGWRKKKKFTGGIGLYPNFVHIDTRGYNATW